MRRLLRPPSGRVTNLTLLVALLLAGATGFGAVATGSTRGRWVVIAHGIAAVAVVLLIPWKTRVVRAGLRQKRPSTSVHAGGGRADCKSRRLGYGLSRWVSLLLATLAVTTLFFGIGYATGLVRSVDDFAGMWLHVAAALALLPLVVWHVVARWTKPRRADLSRRTAVLFLAAAGLYALVDGAVRLTKLPGARRRFTGSYETASFQPALMPTVIWLNDSVPDIDLAHWQLSIVDSVGTYTLSLPQLSSYGVTRRATLDCTSGWYADQDWTGVPVPALLRSIGDARSLLVHSVTGYWLRFPVADLDSLLLATAVGGTPLSAGHGYPLRLVAPGRRGFWWVKWVDRIEVQSTPWWWQSPFPLT